MPYYPYWHIGHLPPPHPGRSRAVFVVHGIGRREWTETAAELRSSFEDAMEAIREWQEKEHGPGKPPFPAGAQTFPREQIAPPFIHDGFWSDYQDLEATFKEEWARFTPSERLFFSHLWKLRASVFRTYWWCVKQQFRLVFSRAVRKEVGWIVTWLIYLPMLVIGLPVLTLSLLRFRKLYQHFLNDVRMYVEPRGYVERAIVERIDERVTKAFLELIGLDEDFRELPPSKQVEAGGQRFRFDRVVWVSHSLGTVISYNVLAKLFQKADELEQIGDPAHRAAVARFRASLQRFITLGSPLDKIDFLYPKALHPWPPDRTRILPMGDATEPREWWINFHHVLDPVSGALSNKRICGGRPPANYHVRSSFRAWLWALFVPGMAHVAYWTDSRTLRYILGRTYGRENLYDQPYRPLSMLTKLWLGALGKVFWVLLLGGTTFALIYWGPTLVRIGWDWFRTWLGF